MLNNASQPSGGGLCLSVCCLWQMQSWIDQAKNKLFDIISQAKKDVANLNLRVAFVGWVLVSSTHRNTREVSLLISPPPPPLFPVVFVFACGTHAHDAPPTTQHGSVFVVDDGLSLRMR